MSLDPVKELARNLATTANEQEAVKQNLSGDDTEALLQLQSNEKIKMTGSFTAYKYYYSSNSFIIDHIVYGQLDSTVFLLDGGYAIEEAFFPLTFPVDLGIAEELLYSTTF